MKRKGMLSLGVAAVVLAALSAGTYAQGQFDKYTLKSPGDIAFSDFRGYESWEMVPRLVPTPSSRSCLRIQR